jgi:hypothetical protein
MNILFKFLILILLLSLVGCTNDKDNSEIERAESPDGKYYAVVFIRNVGATTDFSMQVSIIKQGSFLGNTSGNIFICDSDHGKAIPQEDHTFWLKLSWLSPSELIIQYDERVRIFKKIQKYKNINIRYDPVQPPFRK